MAYLALTVLFSYPLIRNFNSFIMGWPDDGSMSMWGLWWIKYSLMDLGQNPLNCGYLFSPDGTSLVFHSIPKLLGIVSLPLQYIFSLTTAFNLIFMATFVGTGLATYWLAYYLIKKHIPAFIVGAIFAFSQYRWGQISHLTLLSTILLPVFVLFLIKGREDINEVCKKGKMTLRNFFIAGVVLGMAAYDTEIYAIFLSLFSLLYLSFYFPYKSIKAEVGKWGMLCGGVAIIVVVSLLIYLPMIIAAGKEVSRNGVYAGQASESAAFFSADLRTITIPNNTSDFLGGMFKEFHSMDIYPETSYLGWTAVLLAVYGVIRYRRRREIWLWVIVAAIFTILALGPKPLYVYTFLPENLRGLPGPFSILPRLPLLNGLRVPSRFVVMTTMAVSMLAGYGSSQLLSQISRLKWHRFLAPVAVLFIFCLLFIECKPNYVSTSTNIPQVFESVKSTDDSGSILIIPLGWATGNVKYGNSQTWTQLPQTVHERPMIGGMVARAPEEELMHEADLPVLGFLADPENRKLTAYDTDPEEISRIKDRYQFAYIICYKSMPDFYIDGHLVDSHPIYGPETMAIIDEYITSYLGFDKFEETDELIAYKSR